MGRPAGNAGKLGSQGLDNEHVWLSARNAAKFGSQGFENEHGVLSADNAEKPGPQGHDKQRVGLAGSGQFGNHTADCNL